MQIRRFSIPKFLRLNNVSLGDFLSKDGRQPVLHEELSE